MLLLALSSARTRRAALLGALVATTVTVALVTAWTALLLSGREATPRVDRFGAAAVVVRPDPDIQLTDGGNTTRLPLDRPIGLPASAVDRMRSVPGVRDVVTDTPVHAQIADPARGPRPGTAVTSGHGWSAAALTPFDLTAGTAPRAADDVVLDAATAHAFGLAVGDTAHIMTRDGTGTYRVAGIAAPRGGRDGLPSRSVMFFTDATATRLATSAAPTAIPPTGLPPGAGAVRFDFAGVLVEADVDTGALVAALRAALAEPGSGVTPRAVDTPRDAGAALVPVQLLTGKDRARAGAPEVARPLSDATLLFGMMGGIGAFLSVFAIAGAFGLALLGRAREFALLRAVGATAWQVRRMVAGEAGLVALVAAVPGCLLGVPLAHGLRDVLVERAGVPAELTVSVGPGAAAAGVGAGFVLVLVSALTAARFAVRVRAAEALREAAAPTRLVTRPRVLLAVPALGGAVALFVLTQHLGGEVGVAFQTLVLILLAIVVLLLAPLLVRMLEPPVGGLVALAGRTTGGLAHAASAAAVRRVASGAAAVMLSVALAAEVLLVGSVLHDVTGRQARDRTQADAVLTAADDGARGLPREVADAVRALPGVAAVSATRPTTVVSRVLGTPDVLPGRTVDPATAERVLDLGVRDGSLAALAEPGTVAVGRTHAGEHGWHVGSRVTVRLGDGTEATLRVVAVYDRPLGFGDFVFGEATAAGRTADVLDDAVYVRAAPGQRAAVAAALDRYAATHPTVEVRSGRDYAADAETGLARSATGSYLVLGVLAVFTAISLVNTLVVGTADRRREFALLRLAGASRRQVVATVLLETLIVVTIGTLLGTAIACVALAGANGALTGDIALALPLAKYSLILAATAGLGLAAALLPAGLALRGRPLAVLTAAPQR